MSPGHNEATRRRGSEAKRFVVSAFGRLVSSIALLACLGFAALPIHQVAAAGGVQPSQGAPGTTFTITADGYTARERVATWVNTPSDQPQDVPTWTFANDAGVATWQWSSPVDAVSGSWQLVGRGVTSRHLNLIPVQIVAGATPQPTPASNQSATPAGGSPGTTFIFSADGFRAREDIDFWATPPSAAPEANSTQAESDDNGHAVWTWVAPPDATSGTWVMTAQGKASAVVRQISFVISSNAASSPTDGVIPVSGPPGTSFHFGFSDFEHEARLTYWTVSPDSTVSEPIPEFRADRNGHVEFDWIAPENAAGGEWQMVVLSIDRRTSRSIFFGIERNTTPPPLPQGVTPASGRYGDELHFFAEGLRKNEIIGFWATDPVGAIVPSGREVRADGNGRAEWSWIIPQTVRTGPWTMSFQASHNDRSEADKTIRSIRFEVR